MIADRASRVSIRAVGFAVLAVIVAGVVAISLMVRTGYRSEPSPAAAPDAVTVPSAPPATPAVGSYVDSNVNASGEVSVRQWIRSTVPVQRLELTTADPDSLPGTVEASRVVVRAPNGSRLAVRSTVGTQTQRVRLRALATELYLTYTIAGNTLATETPTVAGRLLARVTAMDVVFKGEAGPTVRQVRGPGTVLNVACLALGAASQTPPTPCGAATTDGGWQVELRGPRRHDRLIAQLGG